MELLKKRQKKIYERKKRDNDYKIKRMKEISAKAQRGTGAKINYGIKVGDG